ncbi:C40 family peptidase [Paenibacillus sp. P96]|uniref:C40 family peptidase n=1 Tax=Paenibacillus zeirhizosphaerae TaxID=2987519 RepID=A0ABT9FUC5_9BACL|nr:C40 family peptidase [Paenibacillus sp. P96]MDP4098067.1 C40 family peptidase [Paenibacillus sp. P96]
MKKRALNLLLASAMLCTVSDAVFSSAASAASTAILPGQKAVIQSAVRLRTAPSTDSETAAFLKQGETVTVLAQAGSYWYKVKTITGLTGYASSSSQYIKMNASPAAVVQSVSTAVLPLEQAPVYSASGQAASDADVVPLAGQANGTGTIQTAVNLREQPSTQAAVLGVLGMGEVVSIVDTSDPYWYKVTTFGGLSGYVSSSERFLKKGGILGSTPAPQAASAAASPWSGTVSPTPQVMQIEPAYTGTDVSEAIEQVIATGMTYLGTPYEFGSDRNTTDTFDCSDFIRQIFLEGLGYQLPADSRQQGSWVQQNSNPVYDMSELKRGDLVFFDYASSRAEAEAGLGQSNSTITHVAIYLGNNQLLHTFSAAAGGVKVTDFSKSWQEHFLFGGSAADRIYAD